jgi:hypothetical protein
MGKMGDWDDWQDDLRHDWDWAQSLPDELTLKQAVKKFPNAVRGIENIHIGKRYVEFNEGRKLGDLGRLKFIHFMVLEGYIAPCLIFEDDHCEFASDVGIVPYEQGYNCVNHIEEVKE